MELANRTEPVSSPEAGGRAEVRSNIFVDATIASDDGCGPIRIRNLSSVGALIEGHGVPTEGSRVRLSRGDLKISGTIAWQSGDRAGVRFDSVVSVPEWLPRSRRGQQQRIDKVVHAFKSSAPGPAGSVALPVHSPVDLRAELLGLENSLRRIAEDLARDIAMCELHLHDVQLIDIAAQTLSRVTAIVDETGFRSADQ
jgi:hypothetical protein